jgi:hypothetical protein
MSARGRRRRGPFGVVANALARRRAATGKPRVVVRNGAGRIATLAADDPAARRLIAAAERLVSAVQRGS